MKNIVLKVTYDGSSYLGWQKNGSGPTIEEALERAVAKILNEKITLQAASRTDAGVHAQFQIVNFFTSRDIDEKKLQKSINALLPKTIAITHLFLAPLDFHPTLDSLKKRYSYLIFNSETHSPHLRHISWHVPQSLDLEEMQKCIPYLLGRKDFTSFCNVRNTNYPDKTRTIFELKIIEKENNIFNIEITGDHFLYKMVRNIVGTIVYVGRKKIPVEMIEQILLSRERKNAGITAPANGLSLTRIFYPKEIESKLYSP